MKLNTPGFSPKAHQSILINTPNIRRSQTEKRRSSRMALNASIGLSGEDRQKIAFSMPAKATSLNQHGAAIRLHRDLLVGSTVLVRNQRGAQVSARVVAQLAALQEVPTYAIEFVEQDEKTKNFWGIAFPSNGK
jgi:hypothetical protein